MHYIERPPPAVMNPGTTQKNSGSIIGPDGSAVVEKPAYGMKSGIFKTRTRIPFTSRPWLATISLIFSFSILVLLLPYDGAEAEEMCGNNTCRALGISKDQYDKNQARKQREQQFIPSGNKVCGLQLCSKYPGGEAQFKKDQQNNLIKPKLDPGTGTPTLRGQPTTGGGQTGSSGYKYRGGGCLIATAALGTEMVPDVQNLRQIRNTLYGTDAGWAIYMINSAYYTFSPGVADAQRASPLLNSVVRGLVTPAISTYSLLDPKSLDEDELVLGTVLLGVLNAGIYFVIPGVCAYKVITLSRRGR